MRLVIFPTVLLLAAASTASGQARGSILGAVLLPDGAPAAGASVTLRGVPGHRATADSAGRFRLGEVPAGRYVLVGTRGDLNPGTESITVRGADTVIVTLRLGRAVELSEIAVTATVHRPYVADTATAGSKMPVPLRDLPQTITVVPEAVIRDRNVTSVSRLADNVSGVVPLVGYDGYGLNEQGYIIRGFATSYTSHSLRDGFRDFAGVVPRDLASVEREEFLKGPSSVLYGATGALGGVPNTVTRKPVPYRITEVEASGDTRGMARGTFDLAGPLNADSTVRARLIGAGERSRNFRPFDGGAS
jgi:outer membrane receptor protein involved in Fe transport